MLNTLFGTLVFFLLITYLENHHSTKINASFYSLGLPSFIELSSLFMNFGVLLYFLITILQWTPLYKMLKLSVGKIPRSGIAGPKVISICHSGRYC